MPNQPNILGTIANGIAGVTASVFAYVATLAEDVELYMRMTAVFLGIVVSILTIIKVMRDLRK